MLSREASKAIHDFISNECGELTNLRDKLGTFKRSVFSKIRETQEGQLTDKPQFLYNFATINLELSNSIRESTMAGYLLSAHGLLRWQLVLWQKAFVMFNYDSIYLRWKRGQQIKESELRKYIRDHFAKDQGSPATQVLGYGPQMDDDWVDFDNLSKMLHLHYDNIPSMLDLCNWKYATDIIKHLSRRVLYQDIRNTAQFMTVAMDCLRNVGGKETAIDYTLNKSFDEIKSVIHELGTKYDNIERERGWNDSDTNGS